MSKTPEGWTNCKIGEVTQIVSGGTPPSKDLTNFITEGGIPWITPADLSGYKDVYISRGARNLSEKGFWACSATKIPQGSVLLSSRAPVGYVAIAANELTTNQGFKSFVLPEGLDSRFVYFYLKHIKDVAEAMATGTTFKELSGSVTAQLPLLIAPLNEQRRIAEKLDSLLERVDACRDRLDRVPRILTRFRQSVLLLAMSGELTEDWRQTSHEYAEWQNVLLSEVCVSITDGTHQPPPQTERGIPFITIAAINDGRLHIDKATRFVSSSYFEQLQASRKPELGDILFSVTGSIAIPALVDVRESFIFQRHIAILKPDFSQIVSKFLLYSLSTENIKRQAQAAATGTAQKTIPLSGLRGFVIDLPSIDEQQEIVRCVETLFAYADRLENRYRRACTIVEQLTPALLDKAFRGDLVPQDPNDETASVLLNHIRMMRVNAEATVTKPRQRKSTSDKPSQSEVAMLKRKDIQISHLSDILKVSGSMTAENLWSASQLEIDDFYEQLKDEEASSLLKETREEFTNSPRLLEAV